MPYEVFEKKRSRMGQPAITLSSNGRIYFNKELSRWLDAHNVKAVLMLWDKKASKVGVKGTEPSDGRAYRLAHNAKRDGQSITAKTFLNWIGYKGDTPLLNIIVEMDDKNKLMEFEIPRECMEKV